MISLFYFLDAGCAHRQADCHMRYDYLDEIRYNILHKMMRKYNWKNCRKNANPILLLFSSL